mgnify:CR=1 FL=1
MLSFLLACTGTPPDDPVEKPATTDDRPVLDDISRLNATPVSAVVTPTTEAEIVAAIGRARSEGRGVSISGVRHSQGAHTFGEDNLVIDMTAYNKVLDISAEAKTIRVQAGASWNDIQEAINPHGLAVLTMQSSNIFTVGGSISANIHGRDPAASVIIDTVQSLSLIHI